MRTVVLWPSTPQCVSTRLEAIVRAFEWTKQGGTWHEVPSYEVMALDEPAVAVNGRLVGPCRVLISFVVNAPRVVEVPVVLLT